MALFTDKLNVVYTGNGNSVSSTIQSFQGDAQVGFDNIIPDSTTNGEVRIAFDHSALKMCIFDSDWTVTVKTNDSVAPGDTLTITGGQPNYFYVGGPFANLFTASVTKLFITNASGHPAHVQFRALYDATPVLGDIAK